MQRERLIKNMEGDHEMSNFGGGNIPASPRWNPTKEQITMLENWYKQGIRTPTAEQIRQITARLQAYGHIEGKNVFYWFQNHKARQRQKQKQESLAFFTRCFHKPPNISPPVFPPSPNVFFRPYPKMLLPAGFIKKRPNPDTSRRDQTQLVSPSDVGYESTLLAYPYRISTDCTGAKNNQPVLNKHNDNKDSKETLSLFPLEPTGVLQTSTSSSSSSSLASTSAVIPTTDPSSSSGINVGFGDHQPYFDFFAGSESD